MRSSILPKERAIAGTTSAEATAINASTTISSKSVKPELCFRFSTASSVLPVHDVGVHAIAARLSVGAITHQVIIAVVAGRFVNVGMAPGIHRDLFLQIRAVPLLHARRLGLQCFQAHLR